MARIDPLRNFRFKLEIKGITEAGFSEVMIAETSTEAIEYRLGTDPRHVQKLSGLTKYGNITLKRGVTYGQGALDLFNWHKDATEGLVKDARRTVTISVMDEANEERARFRISEAWPVKYDPSDLNAKGNEVLIELLELANEGIERVK
ncbi:MAG TPA: phage tail protein [Thermoanaerobaculia bacterium]|nr:phage tail protein [Thermoanaerobaculia bacterium]